MLKRVLLAYARFNKSTGYCQGFNIIAAVILKVVEFDEEMALKVCVCVFVYVRAAVHACVHVCMCVRVHVHMHACIRVEGEERNDPTSCLHR